MSETLTIDQAIARAEQATQQRRFAEARSLCNAVLAVTEHPVALALLGDVLTQEGDARQGRTLLRRAIQLQPQNAHWLNAGWFTHLAAACQRAFLGQEALTAAREAVRLAPDSVQNLFNLANVSIDMDDRDGALTALLRALGLNPNYAEGHFVLGEHLLAQGEFDPGWIEYEWRNRTRAAMTITSTIAAWNGMKLPNGRLLVACDQGHGDVIQFSRYIPMAAQRCLGISLAWACPAPMAPLLADIPGVSKVYLTHESIPGHAAHVRLSSLPYLFRTRIDTIPRDIPYLKAHPARIGHWRRRLDATLPAGVKRIGLIWTGNPANAVDWRRSMPLSLLTSLADAGPAGFVSLQKPMPARDLATIPLFPGMTDLCGDLTDFGETAAIIENLDLMITVDTATAHLAGALGKPVWILLPKNADWRWLLDREDSPWYPTARLFRQRKPGDWDEPVERLRAALNDFLKAFTPRPESATPL